MNKYVFIIVVWVFILSSCQTLTLKGKTINQEGERIDNVTILVKNKNLQTISNSTGLFHLPNLKLADTIIFLKSGFSTQQIIYEPILDGRELTIIMVDRQN